MSEKRIMPEILDYFIEIYYKGDKENEDRERLLHFIKNNYNERC